MERMISFPRVLTTDQSLLISSHQSPTVVFTSPKNTLHLHYFYWLHQLSMLGCWKTNEKHQFSSTKTGFFEQKESWRCCEERVEEQYTSHGGDGPAVDDPNSFFALLGAVSGFFGKAKDWRYQGKTTTTKTNI